MKNKELLNKCYSFFNRFITADELIKELTNMDTSNLSKEDIKEQNKLIKGIKNIIPKRIYKDYLNYRRFVDLAIEKENAIRHSWSYRIGHFLLFPSRFAKKIKSLLTK